jgi:outer membrane protein
MWVCLGLLGASPAAAQGAGHTLKIAFVNARQLLQQTPGYTAAESTFNHEVQGYRDEVQKMQHQLDSAAQAFEQQSIALSPAAKLARQKELQQQSQRLEQRSNELQQKAQQREQELMQPIQARINAVIQGLRAEGNYSFILDAEAVGGSIVAADPSLDITSQVLQRLKQSQ